MVGFSWFLTRSSIQVQAWLVHQVRPNRGVGLRRLCPGQGGIAGQNHSSTKSIARLDVQAASPTAKMADLTRRQFLLLPKWQTRHAQVQFLSRQIHHCPFRRSLASKPTGSSPQFHFLLKATPPLSAGRGLLSGERKEEEEPLGPPPLYEQ